MFLILLDSLMLCRRTRIKHNSDQIRQTKICILSWCPVYDNELLCQSKLLTQTFNNSFLGKLEFIIQYSSEMKKHCATKFKILSDQDAWSWHEMRCKQYKGQSYGITIRLQFNFNIST